MTPTEDRLRHITLLGDSIFDYAAYVPGEPAVIDHLRGMLPENCIATIVARDGDVVADVDEQLRLVPDETTHIALSIDGKDALNARDTLTLPAESVYSALGRLAEMRESFHRA